MDRPHRILRSYDRWQTWKAAGEMLGRNFLPCWYPGANAIGEPHPTMVRAHALEFPNGNGVASFCHPALY